MLQAFIIVLREGFEAFLIIAIIMAYLMKRGLSKLNSAVYWGIFASIIASGIAGYLLREGIHTSFWEGMLGIVTIVLVSSLIIHMWRVGKEFKSNMENKLQQVSEKSNYVAAWLGIFVFTILMITREGMETAVMLIQVQDTRFALGVAFGAISAAALSYTWVRFSSLINLRRFFQVTGIFLLLFLVQVGIYSVHEFAEAGILPRSEFIHTSTEVFSPMGLYGRWFSLLNVVVCAIWLAVVWIMGKRQGSVKPQV